MKWIFPERRVQSSKTSAYRQVHRIATLLLALMAALYALTIAAPFPGSNLLRAFSEAAMVGALADWFAVTALFRHPLGIPIPHTAIIPKSQARIAQNLARFIEENFLVNDVIQRDNFGLAESAARWLQDPDHRALLIDRLRAVVPRMALAFEDRDFSNLLRETLVAELRKIDLAPAAGKVLSTLTAGDAHEAILDELVKLSRDFFRRQSPWIRKKVSDVSPWFVPDFVDRRVFDAIAAKSEETFAAMLTDRNHELRRRIHIQMTQFIAELETSPDYLARGKRVQEILLTNPAFLDYLSVLRRKLVDAVSQDLGRSDSRLARIVDSAIQGLVVMISEDDAFKRRTNRSVQQVLAALIGAHRGDIAHSIAKTVQGWKSSALVDRLEEQVGKDLQYIRINGTLVGGLVGIGLYVVTRVVGG